MKTKNVTLTSFVVLLSIVATLCADSEAADTRPYMGVWLDTSPLPDLLIKHLGLSPDQGIRISNVHCDSSADKAGLERDDIIIGFEGKKVLSSESQEFIDEVRKAGIGTEVTIEIIHLGQRKTVRLKLESFKGEREFKYPPEPEIIQSWQPGKIFRLKFGDKDWNELLLRELSPKIKADIDKYKSLNKLFKELHTYHHSDGEDYTITIEGNPNDKDVTIIVRIGDTEYKTTVKEIDKLPKKYREAAEQALKNAQKSSKTRKFTGRAPVYFRRYDVEKLYPHVPPFGPGNQMFDNIEKQMRKLQERIEELEKRLKEMPERFPDKPDKQESQEQEKPAQPKNKDRLRV